MKIVVCIKQVPDTVDVKIDPKTKNLDRTNIKGVINPFDNNAIEEAIRIKEKHGGNITVISMGPPQTNDSLKKALAMGCDDAILLSAREFGGADTLATGYTLARAIQKIGDVDIILFGRHAVDADTGQTGPIVAEFLSLPQITFARSIEISDGYVYASRLLESSTQKVKVKMPVVITVTKELNTPRYASPLNIMKAAKKQITVWNHIDLQCDIERIGLKGSPTAVKEIFEPVRNKINTIIIKGCPEEAAKEFVDLLHAEKLL
ncbi:MAG: electron transfer flavoprotein subunit beta/FixA family protein [Eubacteriaceae bacterium]|nr:electron transfer flavoprotein subunit beta/FixA family protein [Eubacteriaceae bacterium]